MDTHQKHLIAIASGIVILLFIVTLVVVRSSTQTPPTTTEIPVAPTIEAAHITPPGRSDWISYTSKTFSVQYPPGWRAFEYNTGTDDTLVMIKKTQNSDYPSFSVITTTDMNDLAVKDSLYTSYGLSKIVSDFGGDPEYIYKGVVPEKIPVQETNFVIVHGLRLYTMSYHYTTTGTSAEDQDILQRIAASFAFTGR